MDLWQYLKKTDKPIVLYGMGNGADKIISVLENIGVKVSGVFATDGFVRNKIFHGFNLSTYDALKKEFGDMIVLLAFGSGRSEVINNVKRISAEQEFFVPDVPVFGGGLFDSDYVNQNKADLEFIYSRLADDISKKTFENVIKFKLSGKPQYIFDCEVPENEPYESFLRLTDNETFLDLGAYNGDTVKGFLKEVSSYKKIIAVEPDKKTVKKLERNTAEIKNIEIINACITDFSGEAEFSMKSGRNSTIGNGEKIRAARIDEIGADATFIKMDIEGEELRAINGAKKTILKSPKMQIACYHQNDDLIAIPKAVFEINNNYKLYLRHFPCLPAWDLNYYFI